MALLAAPSNLTIARVWIVWRPGHSCKRTSSRVFKVCIIIVAGYVPIFVAMIFGRVALIRSDGVCIIGVEDYVWVFIARQECLLRLICVLCRSITLVVYDLFVNCVRAQTDARPRD